MGRLFFLKFFTTFIFISSFSANAQSYYKNTAFSENEKLTYDAVYQWGFIWVEAGIVTFEVKKENYFNTPCYLFEAKGTSLPKYDWLYKVRDNFKSYVDARSMHPLFFELNNSEGDYKAYENYKFDYELKKIFTLVHNSKKPLKRDTLSLNIQVSDVLSAVYYCRNINFNQLSENEQFSILIIIEGKTYPIVIKYLGKTKLTTKDKKHYDCIKISAIIGDGTIFKKGEKMDVWFTDDSNRVPVLVEAKILLGSVKAVLKKTENLRYISKNVLP